MCDDKGWMGGMMQKCDYDTKKLPPMMEKLDLNDKQKEQVVALRAEGKEFHNKQHEKMMAVLTPEQRAKLDGMKIMMNERKGKMCPKGSMMHPQMGAGGMGCKNCDPK